MESGKKKKGIFKNLWRRSGSDHKVRQENSADVRSSLEGEDIVNHGIVFHSGLISLMMYTEQGLVPFLDETISDKEAVSLNSNVYPMNRERNEGTKEESFKMERVPLERNKTKFVTKEKKGRLQDVKIKVQAPEYRTHSNRDENGKLDRLQRIPNRRENVADSKKKEIKGLVETLHRKVMTKPAVKRENAKKSNGWRKLMCFPLFGCSIRKKKRKLSKGNCMQEDDQELHLDEKVYLNTDPAKDKERERNGEDEFCVKQKGEKVTFGTTACDDSFTDEFQVYQQGYESFSSAKLTNEAASNLSQAMVLDESQMKEMTEQALKGCTNEVSQNENVKSTFQERTVASFGEEESGVLRNKTNDSNKMQAEDDRKVSSSLLGNQIYAETGAVPKVHRLKSSQQKRKKCSSGEDIASLARRYSTGQTPFSEEDIISQKDTAQAEKWSRTSQMNTGTEQDKEYDFGNLPSPSIDVSMAQFDGTLNGSKMVFERGDNPFDFHVCSATAEMVKEYEKPLERTFHRSRTFCIPEEMPPTLEIESPVKSVVSGMLEELLQDCSNIWHRAFDYDCVNATLEEGKLFHHNGSKAAIEETLSMENRTELKEQVLNETRRESDAVTCDGPTLVPIVGDAEEGQLAQSRTLVISFQEGVWESFEVPESLPVEQETTQSKLLQVDSSSVFTEQEEIESIGNTAEVDSYSANGRNILSELEAEMGTSIFPKMVGYSDISPDGLTGTTSAEDTSGNSKESSQNESNRESPGRFNGYCQDQPWEDSLRRSDDKLKGDKYIPEIGASLPLETSSRFHFMNRLMDNSLRNVRNVLGVEVELDMDADTLFQWIIGILTYFFKNQNGN